MIAGNLLLAGVPEQLRAHVETFRMDRAALPAFERTGPKGSSAPMGREKIPEAGGHADTLSCKFCFSLPKNPWQERLRTSPFVLDTNPSWPQYVPCSVN
jgi:hypothetical protein